MERPDIVYMHSDPFSQPFNPRLHFSWGSPRLSEDLDFWGGGHATRCRTAADAGTSDQDGGASATLSAPFGLSTSLPAIARANVFP